MLALLTYLIHGAEFFLGSCPVSASQEIPRILWNPKVLYRIYKCPNRDFLRQHFVTRNIFYGKELLAPCPTPKLEYHPLLALCICLINIFAGTLHIGGRSSVHNLRTRHAVLTGTHLSWCFVDQCLVLYMRSFTKKAVDTRQSVVHVAGHLVYHLHVLHL
jgi:hypothetical protein